LICNDQIIHATISEESESEEAHSSSDYTDWYDQDEMESLLTWFNWHDVDQDGYLDGGELLQAFSEWDRQDSRLRSQLSADESDSEDGKDPNLQLLTVMRQMVDHVLMEDDLDGDGTVSSTEFLRSQNY
jgi:Ca2+-binding EF-hand superfamily protein